MPVHLPVRVPVCMPARALQVVLPAAGGLGAVVLLACLVLAYRRYRRKSDALTRPLLAAGELGEPGEPVPGGAPAAGEIGQHAAHTAVSAFNAEDRRLRDAVAALAGGDGPLQHAAAAEQVAAVSGRSATGRRCSRSFEAALALARLRRFDEAEAVCVSALELVPDPRHFEA